MDIAQKNIVSMAAIFAALLGVCLCGAAMADEDWSLTTADFQRQAVAVKSLEEAGLSVTKHGTDRLVPLTQFLMLSRGQGAAASKGTCLCMVSGDRIGGELMGMKDDKLTWWSGALGEMTISVRDVRAFVPADVSSETLVDHSEDVVVLVNRDTAGGIITSIDAQKLVIQPTGGDATSLPRASVSAIYFASAGRPAGADAPGYRIGFTDGSVFTVATVRIESGKLIVRLAGKGEVADRTVDMASVRSIEQLNGPVGWLSSRKALSSDQVAFSADQAFPARMDRNVKGGPIMFGNRTFDRGIGVHANSKLVYELDGTFKGFRTQYAVDGAGDVRYANVTVRILVDDKVVSEQGGFKAGVLAPVVSADLEGHKTLTLEVLAGNGNFGTQDRLNWIEPALLREKPTPAPAVPAATSPASKPTGP